MTINYKKSRVEYTTDNSLIEYDGKYFLILSYYYKRNPTETMSYTSDMEETLLYSSDEFGNITNIIPIKEIKSNINHEKFFKQYLKGI